MGFLANKNDDGLSIIMELFVHGIFRCCCFNMGRKLLGIKHSKQFMRFRDFQKCSLSQRVIYNGIIYNGAYWDILWYTLLVITKLWDRWPIHK